MRYFLLFIALLAGIAAWLYLRPVPKGVGETMEDFTLDTVSGRAFDFSSLHGKTAILIFFSLDGEESTEFFRLSEFLTKPLKGRRDIRTIALVQEGEAERVRLYLSQFKYNGDVLLDPDGTVAKSLNLTSFPAFYIVGPDQVITYNAIGWDRDYIREMIQAVRPADN